MQVPEIHHELGMRVAQLHTAVARMVSGEVVKIQRLARAQIGKPTLPNPVTHSDHFCVLKS